MTINIELIYKELETLRLSGINCAKFLQAIAVSGGNIVAHHTDNLGYSSSQANSYVMCFKLSFKNEEQVKIFESYGFKLENAEIVVGCSDNKDLVYSDQFSGTDCI